MCSISGTERGTTKRSIGRNGSDRAGLALGKHRLGVSSALREDTDTTVMRKQTTMTEEPNRDNGNTTGDLMADGSERLWSNIGTSKSGDNDAPRMVPEPGSLPGAIALVAEAEQREAQVNATNLHNVGMVVAADRGDAAGAFHPIHPPVRLFWAILYSKPNICQDRFGTNTGKTRNKARFCR